MSEAKADATYRVGVDIGGTFTDLILVETTSGAITVGKSLTTPTDPSEAVETVLRDALEPVGRRGRPASSTSSTAPRWSPTPDRAEGREDGAADHQGVPRRGRDRPRAPLRPVRPLPGDADAAGAALPAAWRSTSGSSRRQVVQAARTWKTWSRWSASCSEKGIEAVAVCFLHSYANPPTSGRSPT